ncbi:MAG: hypothetical protein WA160_05540 [Pseudobdellovibrio sp.]
MNYRIQELHSDNPNEEQVAKIKDFCQKAVDENKHASRANMQVDSWEEKNASLLYLLIIEKRFLKEKGGLLLLLLDDQIIAVSGYYLSSFDEKIFILGVRSWVLKKYRLNLLIANWLLPYQIEQVKIRRGHTAIISFNEANKAFAKLIERSNKNPEIKNKFFFGENYPEIYKDMIYFAKPVKIKNVKQWILIKKIEPSSFDWNSILWEEKED